MAHSEREGIEGLKEKRGTSTGSKNGRPKKAKILEEEVLRLRAENALLKKLWELQRGEELNDVKTQSANQQLPRGLVVLTGRYHSK